jgi:tRNA (guanine6-N2)-methyltransferase
MPLSELTESVVELEIAPGLEQIALDEMIEHYNYRLVTRPIVEEGAIRFGYTGNLGGLLALNTVNAVYLLETYDVPRPKAFLGHAHFTRLLDQIATVRELSAPDAYQSIHISAAGSGSSVMRRLLDELANATHLTPGQYEGDLWLRLRRAAHGNGWDALVRLSPRPNATRGWRVVNVAGALDAAVARAMVRLSEPAPDQVVLNVASGSGSLAIERALAAGAERIIACDIDDQAMAAAHANIDAAGLSERIEMNFWDATDIPIATSSADVMLADLPFGHHVGSHQQNRELYPALLEEAARVLRRGGVFVIITHEIKLMEVSLLKVKKWIVEQEIRVTLSGLHPRIYCLRRL